VWLAVVSDIPDPSENPSHQNLHVDPTSSSKYCVEIHETLSGQQLLRSILTTSLHRFPPPARWRATTTPATPSLGT
jgi:hypothetical protein